MLNERRATLILTRLVPVVSSYVLHLHVAQSSSSSSSVPNPIHFCFSLSLSSTHAKSQISKRAVFSFRRYHENATLPNRSAATSAERRPASLSGEEKVWGNATKKMRVRVRVTATDHGRETSATEALIIIPNNNN